MVAASGFRGMRPRLSVDLDLSPRGLVGAGEFEGDFAQIKIADTADEGRDGSQNGIFEFAAQLLRKNKRSIVEQFAVFVFEGNIDEAGIGRIMPLLALAHFFYIKIFKCR